MPQKSKGKVKWYDEKKGYGFIIPEDGGEDCFVHHSDVKASGLVTLVENDVIVFNKLKNKKGFKAVDIAIA